VSDLLRYDGKRTIVTGAASGMGAETARLVLERGGEVYALDVNEPTVEVTKFLRTDLSDPESVDAAVEAIGGPVHALFNCAGLPNTFPGQQVFTVNFLGHRHLTEKVIPLMTEGGAVATVSSVGGMNFMSHMAELGELCAIADFAEAKKWCEAHDDLVADGYALSKEALIFYTMQRSIPALKQGVRMNCISPGPTDTAMMPAFEEAMGKDFMASFPKPIGRNARAEEQAYPLLFLNSDGASYIAGHNLMVDGGFLGGVMTGQVDVSALMPA
jgi:NAD(P)-dependent dehydrogenase (short-subunit alcohol dehydrogenase family)